MNGNSVTKKRIAWIDIAKFFAIFFVVLGHTVEADNILLSILYFFHVPLFFLLSGITYSYKENQLEFIKSKVKRLYIPYLFVSFVSIIIYMLMGRIIGTIGFDLPSFLDCLYGMLYANVSAGNMMWNRPLWFLPALFVVLIITNLLEAIRNKPLKNILFLALAALGYYLSLHRVFLPLQSETALSMLIWIYIGIKIRKYLFRAENDSKVTLTILALIYLAIGLVVGFYNGSLSVMVDLYGKNILLYIVASLCLSLTTILVSIMIGHNQLLEYIGRNTLFILLWHKFPIEFFQQICPYVKDWIKSPNFWVSDTTSFLVAILAIFLSLLLQLIYHFFLRKVRALERDGA